MVQRGRVVLSISSAIRAEVEDVLSRPKIVQKFPSLTPEAVAVFLKDIDALTRAVADVPTVVLLPRDPKDEPYLNLAVIAAANYLVTWDKDLLDLMADNAEGNEFRKRVPGLLVLTPVVFLREFAQGAATP